MATFVCVHGAFQGGWVWKKTAKALETMGHEVHTPTLSGCGHHRHTMARGQGLPTYLEDIASYMELQDLSDVILVGHSYSGIICCGVMPRVLSRLSGLVFVDAILPLPGKSFADLGGEPFQKLLASRLVDGWLVAPWQPAMFGLVDVPAEEAWFMERVTPFPMAAFTDQAGEGEPCFPEKRYYVRCGANPNPMLANMAKRAEALGFAMEAIDSNHCPQMTVPMDLARKLAVLAEKVVGRA